MRGLNDYELYVLHECSLPGDDIEWDRDSSEETTADALAERGLVHITMDANYKYWNITEAGKMMLRICEAMHR